jgi:hypothetical protein
MGRWTSPVCHVAIGWRLDRHAAGATADHAILITRMVLLDAIKAKGLSARLAGRDGAEGSSTSRGVVGRLGGVNA